MTDDAQLEPADVWTALEDAAALCRQVVALRERLTKLELAATDMASADVASLLAHGAGRPLADGKGPITLDDILNGLNDLSLEADALALAARDLPATLRKRGGSRP